MMRRALGFATTDGLSAFNKRTTLKSTANYKRWMQSTRKHSSP
jgi:hypothetical protein